MNHNGVTCSQVGAYLASPDLVSHWLKEKRGRPSRAAFAMSRASRIEVTPVRLSISILGTEVFAFSTEADSESDEDWSRDLSGGYLTATPIGFVANHERPEDSGLPYREGWE